MHDPADDLPLAFRLQKKPHVILGLTWTECGYASLAAGAGALLSAFLLAGVFGNLMLMMPIFLIFSIGYFMGIGLTMQRYKHNRPDGYYQQQLYGLLQRCKLKEYYIDASGYRDPRRGESNP